MKKVTTCKSNPKKERREAPASGYVKGPVKGYHKWQGK